MGIQLNTHILYNQCTHSLKDKKDRLLHVCKHQLQNVSRIIFPILQHSRQATIHGVFLSTRYVANLTGLGGIYKKASFLLSRRAGRMTNIECEILARLKELSSYCMQLSIDSPP